MTIREMINELETLAKEMPLGDETSVILSAWDRDGFQYFATIQFNEGYPSKGLLIEEEYEL